MKKELIKFSLSNGKEIDTKKFKHVERAIVAITHPFRKRLINFMNELGEQTVTALMIAMRCEQPELSAHLKILHKSRIVAFSKNGVHVKYKLNQAVLVGMWDILLSNFENYETAAKRYKALAHIKRAEIVEYLIQFPDSPANEIYNSKGWEQSETSRFLKDLRLAEMITRKKVGKYRLFRVNEALILKYQDLHDQIFETN